MPVTSRVPSTMTENISGSCCWMWWQTVVVMLLALSYIISFWISGDVLCWCLVSHARIVDDSLSNCFKLPSWSSWPRKARPWRPRNRMYSDIFSRQFLDLICCCQWCTDNCTVIGALAVWWLSTDVVWEWDDWCTLNFSTAFFQLRNPLTEKARSAFFDKARIPCVSCASCSRNRVIHWHPLRGAAMEMFYTRRVETWKFCPSCHRAEVDILPLEHDSVQNAHAPTPMQHVTAAPSHSAVYSYRRSLKLTEPQLT